MLNKKVTFILFVLFYCNAVAQIGIGTSTPSDAAIVEVNSSTSGFLMPRMTVQERAVISNPTAGLMVYCTNCCSGSITTFNGTYWKSIVSCMDTDADGDGFENSIDLDDDNDGILDQSEISNTQYQGQLNYEYYDSAPAGLTVENIPEVNPDAAGTTQSIDVNGLQNDLDPGDTDLFSIRYTGFINIATAGDYRFETNSDDGSKVFVDGVEVVNNDGDHGPTVVTGSYRTYAAGIYSIEIEFYENAGGATLFVNYQKSTDGASSPIPMNILYSFYADADLDSDGTQNHLDLDADGDGCFDVNEGDGSVTSSVINAEGRIIGVTDANGVPVAASGGQNIGSSLNASVDACNP